MLLVIDVGNTNICGGVFQAGAILHSFRIHTVPKKTEDEYAILFKSILADRGVAPAMIGRVVLSSVVPALTDFIEAMCLHLFGSAPVTVGPAVYGLLPLGVPNPREIGADLVANAFAAWKRTKGACIVVDFGTALTFTCVGHENAIKGVAIVPGLGTAVNALSRDTAQLPYVELAAPDSVIGTDTIMSIQAGVVYGYVGLVEHIVGLMKVELGGEVSVLATGGLCRIIADLTPVFDALDPDLTLNGLALIAEYA